MKVQIKRVKRGTYYDPHVLDNKYINATLSTLPTPGKYMALDLETGEIWLTTEIKDIQFSPGELVISTQNSTYSLLDGWNYHDAATPDYNAKQIGFYPEARLEAIWCVDSEAGDDVLMDTITNKELWRGNKKTRERK